MNPSKTFSLNKISSLSFWITMLLLPVFFLPIVGTNNQGAKIILLTLGLAVSLVSLLAYRAKNQEQNSIGKVSLAVLFALPAVFLLGSLFKGQINISLFGYGFEQTTVAALLLLAVTGYLSSVYALQNGFSSKLKKVFLASFGVVALYQVIRLFLPQDILAFGQFFGKYGNLLGKWNDIAILSAIVFVGSFIYMKSQSGRKLYISATLFALSGLLMNIVGFSILFPIVAAIIVLYTVLDSRVNGSIKIFTKSGLTKHRILGLAIGLILMLYSYVGSVASMPNSQGNLLRPNLYKVVNILPNYFGGIPQEVRPSAASTFIIYKKVIATSPVFGSGANRFSESWTKFRSQELNQTPYWNTDFAFGVGYFPTLAVSGGLLGTMAVLVFLGYVLVKLARQLKIKQEDVDSEVILYGLLLLLVMSVAYIPANALLVLMFVGVGYLFAKTPSGSNKKIGNLVALGLPVLALIVFGITLFEFGKSSLASRYFAKASQSINVDRNIDTADSYLKKVLSLSSKDVYVRSYADLLVLKSQIIAEQGKNEKGEISQEARTAALASYKEAEKYADKAITKYPQNYGNYIYAANIYSSDRDMYDKAIDLYNKSLVYNPNNPDAYFGIAKIKAAQNDIEGVKEFITKALEKKEFYTPALLAGAQLSAAQKDVNSTIGLLAKAYQSDRSRSDILLEIANIQYSTTKDIGVAIQTLEYTVGTYPNYAEARLALANLYAKQQKFEDAANLLVGIKTEDQKVKAALDGFIATLRAGKDPFAQTTNQSVKTNATSTKATTTKAVVPVKKK